MSSTLGAQSIGIKADLTSLIAAQKAGIYKEQNGYKEEHHHNKVEHHHHGHKEEHHYNGHTDEHHHHGHKEEHHHHHGHKEEHYSSAYGFSEDISVHFSEAHKQELKTCTSSLGHVLSQVPWMKFRVVAEPDVSCFATDERLQIFMRKVTEITIAIVTKQIREEVTELISKLVTSILTTMTTRISAVQKVVFEHIEEIFTLKDTVTECESLCDIKGKICFGGERCKPSTQVPDCAPCNTEPKEPPVLPPATPKPTLPKEPKKLDCAPDTKPKEPATREPTPKEPTPKEPTPKESHPPVPAPVDPKPTLPKESKKPDYAPDAKPKVAQPLSPAPVDPKPTSSLPKKPLVPASPTASKAPPSVSLSKAEWIWTHEKPVKGGKPYSRPFRHVVHTDTPVDRLTITITCDNRYTLYVNGLLVGRGAKWGSPERYTVSFDAMNDVLIAVYGSEDGGGTAAALIAAGKVWSSQDSTEKEFATSKTWKTRSKDGFDTNFFELSYKDTDWEAATEKYLPMKSLLYPTSKGKDFERWTKQEGLADAPDAPKATIIL